MGDDVSEDVVEEILIRVADCKSAIRCSVVCKRWLSVIERANFKKRFNEKHKDEACMEIRHVFRIGLIEVSLTTDDSNVTAEMSFLPWWEKMWVRACCGGLLLVQVSAMELCICNHLTKEWRLLPRCPDRTMLNTCHGLIVSDDRTAFKVVLAGGHVSSTLRTCVFCSQSGLWTNHALPLPLRKMKYISINAVATSQHTLYWFQGRIKFTNLVAYNPFNSTVDYVNLPRGCHGRLTRVQMWPVQGLLRLSQLMPTSSPKTYSLKIWELVSNKNWRLVHKARPTLGRKALVVAYHPDDPDKMFLCRKRTHLCVYHISRGAVDLIARFHATPGHCHMKNLLTTFTLAHPCSFPVTFHHMPTFQLNHKRRKTTSA